MRGSLGEVWCPDDAESSARDSAGKESSVIRLLKGTLLSVLVFFSISFLYVIYRISPITIGDTYDLSIGFPFKYYQQFQVTGNPYLNSSWSVNNLLLDCLITWVVVTGGYWLIKRNKP